MDKIDTWIENRFGTPNTFHRQLLDNFIEFLEKDLGYVRKDDEEDELKVVGMIRKQEREMITKDIHSIEFESNSATDFLNKTLDYLKTLKE